MTLLLVIFGAFCLWYLAVGATFCAVCLRACGLPEDPFALLLAFAFWPFCLVDLWRGE